MRIILGSQSPRRRELLAGYLGEDFVDVVPPLNNEEPGFDGLRDIAAIEEQLMLIVQQKLEDVAGQVSYTDSVVLCADTIVVAQRPDQTFVVLGKPPADDWQATTKRWFDEYYSGKTHEVWTGFQLVRLSGEDGQCDSSASLAARASRSFQRANDADSTTCRSGLIHSQIVKTVVSMPKLSSEIIDWYLSTEESIGKAGGYGIQGQAAMLIDNVEGSLTNVIGLPMLEVAEAIERMSK